VPVPVLDKRSVFDLVGYKPHKGQTPIHKSTARNRVVTAGRRLGKSVVGGFELYVEAIATRFLLPRLVESGKRREFWIVGPEYTDSEKEFRVLYDVLWKRGAPFDRPGTYNNPHDGDMQLSLYGGKFIVMAKSAKHSERLVGEGLNGVIMAEAGKQRERTWTKFIRPMLADFRGWSLFTTTPEGKNWVYGLWLRGQSTEDDEWESWRLPSWKNNVIYPKGIRDPEILSLRRDLSTETFNQEIAAKFTEFAGRVFKDWDDEVHIKDLQFRPDWQTFAAVDYGFTNPFVWLLIQVDHFGNVYVLDEYYNSGLTIDEAAIEVSSRGLAPSSLRTFYPDPAGPGDTRALENYLKVRAAGGTGGELNSRLRLVRAALKYRNSHLPEDDPERRPRLLVNRRCINTIREMNDYRYPKSAQEAAELGREITEKPMKKDDHCPEALGRFFIGYFGEPSDTGGSRVSDADMVA